jgi:hypothetical protein
VLNQAFDAAIDHNWIPSSAWRCVDFLELDGPVLKRVDFLDDVPVMSATVLGLDLLLHEPSIDFQMASELVLSDVGATVQILRLIGRESEFAVERPIRMGHCLASLDVTAWFGAISARTFTCDREHAAAAAMWKHSHLIAQYAQLVAESLAGISPEDAYLVGLLHEIEAVPAVLGWRTSSPDASGADVSFTMERSLPLFVLAALRTVKDSYASSTWNFILTAAHELAGSPMDFPSSMLRDIDSMRSIQAGKDAHEPSRSALLSLQGDRCCVWHE